MKLPLHTTMTNAEISQVFSFVAEILALEPGNHYRTRAYEEAAVIIRQLPYELVDEFARLRSVHTNEAEAVFAKQLEALPGIGENIAAKLVELLTAGTIKSFQKYAADLPAGMYPLVQLSGLGAKKAYVLASAFHLDDVSTAVHKLLGEAHQGHVQTLDGFGEKSEQQLITILESQPQKTRVSLAEAKPVAEKVAAALQKVAGVEKVEVLGSIRRGNSTVGDIDLGAVVNDVDDLKKEVAKWSWVKRVVASGEQLIRIILDNDWQVDLKMVSADEWGSFLQHFTGSKEHNIRLREYALQHGWSLSEHGIKMLATGEMKTFATEKDFYDFLGFKLIPPTERVGGNEFEKYRK